MIFMLVFIYKYRYILWKIGLTFDVREKTQKIIMKTIRGTDVRHMFSLCDEWELNEEEKDDDDEEKRLKK